MKEDDAYGIPGVPTGCSTTTDRDRTPDTSPVRSLRRRWSVASSTGEPHTQARRCYVSDGVLAHMQLARGVVTGEEYVYGFVASMRN